MAQTLFSQLQIGWEHLKAATETWLNHLEGKYTTSSDEDVQAKMLLSNAEFAMTTMDNQIQRADFETDSGVRDVATKVQSYLESTASLHQDLSQLSQIDDQALIHAKAVQDARVVVAEKVGETKNTVLANKQPSLKIVSPTNFSLAFKGIVGTSNPAIQVITIQNTGLTTLSWQAEVAVASNINWLMVTPTKGDLDPGQTASMSVAALLLQEFNPQSDPYTGSVTISESNHGGSQSTHTIPINFMVYASCSLQPPSVNGLTLNELTFTVEEEASASSQPFNISAVGACNEDVSLNLATDESWLTAATATSPTETNTGETWAITATVTPGNLPAGSYYGVIAIHAMSGGNDIPGSPQIVPVTLNVTATPVLSVNPTSPPAISLSLIAGNTASSEPITLSNTGGGELDWTAQFASPPPPSFITLSKSSGNLAGGSNFSINVNIDATKVHGDVSYQNLTVNINATDHNNPSANVGKASVTFTVYIAENLFMCLMDQIYPQNSALTRHTEKLFKGRERLELSDRELEKLTKSWNQPIAFVTNPPQPNSCLSTNTLADLITLQNQLEELYDRVEKNVTRLDEDLIGLE